MAWRRERFSSVVLVAASLVAGSCDGGGEGSETHFVKCRSDGDCSALDRCERGVCTSPRLSSDAGFERSAPPAANGAGGRPDLDAGRPPPLGPDSGDGGARSAGGATTGDGSATGGAPASGGAPVTEASAETGVPPSAIWATTVAQQATPYDVAVTSNGEIVVAYFQEASTPLLAGMTRVDRDGNIVGTLSVEGEWIDRIATGRDGAIYVAGQSPGNSLLPNGDPSGSVHTEAFLARLSPRLGFVWTKHMGDDPNPFGVDQRVNAVTVDGAGNVIIAGEFAGTMHLETRTLTSAGLRDAFVAKFDFTSTLLWAESFGDAADQAAYDVAVDAADNVLLAGVFGGTVSFGGTPLESSDDMDAFLVKLSPGGDHVFSRSFPAQDARGVRACADGSLVVSGSGTPKLGPGPLPSDPAQSYVARFDADGRYVSSAVLGTFAAEDLDVDSSSSAVVVGATWVSGTIGQGFDPVISRPGIKRFAVPVASTWSADFGEGNGHGARAVAVGPDGAIFVVGAFDTAISIGPTRLTDAEPRSVFLAKLKPDLP